jgi:hypothetical protein
VVERATDDSAVVHTSRRSVRVSHHLNEHVGKIAHYEGDPLKLFGGEGPVMVKDPHAINTVELPRLVIADRARNQIGSLQSIQGRAERVLVILGFVHAFQATGGKLEVPFASVIRL